MWTTLIKVQNLIQKIFPLRIQYHENREGFYKNETKAQKVISFLIDSNTILVWISCLFCLKSVITEAPDPSISVQQSVLEMALHILFFGMWSLVLGAVCTFQSRSSTTVWMMTQAFRFHNKREKNKTVSESEKGIAFSVFDLLLYGMVCICVIAALTFPLMPVLLRTTPLHLILFTFLPESAIEQLKSVPFLITTICCVYLAMLGFVGAILVLQVLLYMCAFLYESTFMLKTAYLKDNLKFLGRSNFFRNKFTFMQSYLFSQSYNDFGYVFFPVVIGTGFVINVVTSFVCIEFYAHLHPLLLISFAGFDVTCTFLTVGIHSFAVISSEESDKFHRYWSLRLFKRKEITDFKACMPITCEIGPYFTLKRTTLLTTMSEIVNATVSLLIMDN